MTTGSDPAAPLGVLADFLREPIRGSASVLLLGPTAAGLFEAAALPDPAAAVSVTAVVRQVADAERLTETGLRVLAGPLDRLPDGETAELVILLDPPERVLTPDTPGCSHVELVELAVRHVAPGGRLVAWVPGALGIDRDRSPVVRAIEGDDAWWRGTQGYADRPPTLPELPWQPSHFVVSVYDEPTLVAPFELPGDAAGRTLLRLALSTDDDARLALDSDVLPAQADGWLVTRGTPWPTTVWSRALGTEPELAPVTADGDSLEHLLSVALRLGKQTALRELLAAYSTLVGTLPAEQRATAVPRRVIVTDAGLRYYPGGEDPDSLPPADVAVAHGLLDLTHALQAPGAAAGFPPEASPDELAEHLGELAGLDATVWPEARDLRGLIELPDRPRRRPAPEGGMPARVAELQEALTERDAQLRDLRSLLDRQLRRVRALEHAMATEHGPLARRALFLMTAPTSRIVEAARSRLHR